MATHVTTTYTCDACGHDIARPAPKATDTRETHRWNHNYRSGDVKYGAVLSLTVTLSDGSSSFVRDMCTDCARNAVRSLVAYWDDELPDRAK